MAKDDIGGVWRTIGGRRVFIKDGQDLASAMKESGKFKRATKQQELWELEKQHKHEGHPEYDKKLKELEEEQEYELYKRAREDENSIDPMTENSTDWEALDKKYKDRYETEKQNSESKFLQKRKQEIEYEREKGIYNGERQVDEEGKYKYQKELDAKEDASWRDKLKDKNTRDEIINKELDESTKGKIKDYYKKEDATTNYRDKITDVAKNSKEDNVTLDVETGKAVNFEKGYSVSFQQSTDNYSDEEYAKKIAECRDKCDGKVYAGKYGGDAEASFHTDNIDDAKELMYKYNQESIYDWEHQTLIMNDKYDASKNKTNFNTETTSDYMNEKIRSGVSKNKVKDDLPKKTEIKTQGTSNRKEVSENIQAHILEYYDKPEDFVEQMDNMNEPTMWRAGETLAKGGSYMIYYDEQRDFLNSLKINPKGKEFSDDKVFNTYSNLIGRESAKLYERLKRNSYKKYLAEHPGSKMTFSDFKDMEKGGK